MTQDNVDAACALCMAGALGISDPSTLASGLATAAAVVVLATRAAPLVLHLLERYHARKGNQGNP